MSKFDYDIVVVGGGLGGSALAKVMAGQGARVLVVERELRFKDRIRGEWMSPWGVMERKELESTNFFSTHAHINFLTISICSPNRCAI
jgi:flavin-dependent dehydrogenase